MKDKQLASGGIIQIKSSFDVRNLCDSKFDVSGGKLGLVNTLGKCNETLRPSVFLRILCHSMVLNS